MPANDNENVPLQIAPGAQRVAAAVADGRLPFRRAVEIRILSPVTSEAALEDDHHRFRVEVQANCGAVSSVRGETVRHPWSLCPFAARELERLVGMPLSIDPTAVLEHANARRQCTHMFDLAGLAISALANGAPAYRRYDVKIEQLDSDLWAAILERDDGYLLGWVVSANEIVMPESLRGTSLKSTFTRWARDNCELEALEAALILRRAAFVGKYRHRRDLDAQATAAAGVNNMGGCFVLQPHRAPYALRMKGATRSFAVGDGRPLLAPP